ncbi:CD1375 family protein [Bacillus chungangensis]|uniref:Uncharacterized protein n=1 Tax=Bacillus chungangensis TaxID=587633 RepID=A0ABT9WPK3_9BACI|nr:hypothetical protein [Bacillus chungangensis]
MIYVYVRLIQAGLRELQQVPVIIRSDVQKALVAHKNDDVQHKEMINHV